MSHEHDYDHIQAEHERIVAGLIGQRDEVEDKLIQLQEQYDTCRKALKYLMEAKQEQDEARADRHAHGVTIEAAAWVIDKIAEAIEVGPSFRGMIYGLMGFGPDAYQPLYEAGGMAITNAIVDGELHADKLRKTLRSQHSSWRLRRPRRSMMARYRPKGTWT